MEKREGEAPAEPRLSNHLRLDRTLVHIAGPVSPST